LNQTTSTVSELTETLRNFNFTEAKMDGNWTAKDRLASAIKKAGLMLTRGGTKQTIDTLDGLTVVGDTLQQGENVPVVIKLGITVSPFGGSVDQAVQISAWTMADVLTNTSSDLVFASAVTSTATSAGDLDKAWVVTLEVDQLPIGKEFQCVQVDKNLEPISSQTCEISTTSSTEVTCTCSPIIEDSTNTFVAVYVEKVPAAADTSAEAEEFPLWAIVLIVLAAVGVPAGVLTYIVNKKKSKLKRPSSPRGKKVAPLVANPKISPPTPVKEPRSEARAAPKSVAKRVL